MCVFQKSATVEEETNDDELYKNIVERASGYTDYPYYPRVPTTSAPGHGLGPCQPHCRALTRPKPQTTRTAETPPRPPAGLPHHTHAVQCGRAVPCTADGLLCRNLIDLYNMVPVLSEADCHSRHARYRC